MRRYLERSTDYVDALPPVGIIKADYLVMLLAYKNPNTNVCRWNDEIAKEFDMNEMAFDRYIQMIFESSKIFDSIDIQNKIITFNPEYINNKTV
jgi:hypothetical protein